MTLLEHYELEREKGREEGRKEEMANTERERRRADNAERRVRELEAQIAALQDTTGK